MLLINLLKQFLRSMNTVKSNEKTLQEQFQLSITCWICEKLIDNEDEKVRDHCHITGKFRGAAH